MGADFHIRGDTKLDSSGFSKGIDKLGSVAKKGAATMQSSFQGAISVLDKVKSKFSSASSEADKFQKKTKETDPYLEKLKSTLKETDQELDKLTKAYREAVVEKGRYSKEAQELANKIKEAERKQSELRSEIEKSSDSFKDAAKDVKKYNSSLSDLKGKVLSGLKLAAASAIGSVLGLGKIGLDYNAQMESYTTDFEVMLGDVGAAAEKVESLKQMAAKTPFELTDLANSTKILLAFNVANEDTNTVLRQLGDISLGNVEKMDSLTRAYGKMNASQKVTLEDINMMIDAGYNPLLNIQEKTGESMSDLYARISDGQVAFSEVQEAIAAATSEGGQFYQGMEKASQTTQGLTSTLRDVVNSKAGEFFSELSQKVKDALPEIIEFIESINVEEVKNRLKELYDQFVELSPIIAAITGAVIGFKTAMTISAIIDGATKAITAFKLANDAATISQAALNFVMNLNPFVLIATLIAGAVAALVVLWNTNEGFRNAVIAIWEAIKQAFSGAWEWIVGVWNQFQPYFQVAWDFLVSVFSQVVQTVSEPFAAAWDAIVDIFTGWGEYFQGLFDKIGEIFSDIWETFKKIGSDAIEALKDGINAAWNGLVSWFNSLWDGLFGNRTANVTVNTHENRTVSTTYAGGSGSSNKGGAGRRSIDGSHRNGLDYVPYDGYLAELHKGETVLTSQQAGLWRAGVVQRMLSAASSVMMANQSRSPVLATAGAPAVSRQTAATVQTQHTTVIDLDGRTVAKVITPFVDQFLF